MSTVAAPDRCSTVQYSQAPCCVSKFALRLAQGARQTGVTGIIQETWRLVPAAEKSARYRAADFRGGQLNTSLRSLGKKLA